MVDTSRLKPRKVQLEQQRLREQRHKKRKQHQEQQHREQQRQEQQQQEQLQQQQQEQQQQHEQQQQQQQQQQQHEQQQHEQLQQTTILQQKHPQQEQLQQPHPQPQPQPQHLQHLQQQPTQQLSPFPRRASSFSAATKSLPLPVRRTSDPALAIESLISRTRVGSRSLLEIGEDESTGATDDPLASASALRNPPVYETTANRPAPCAIDEPRSIAGSSPRKLRRPSQTASNGAPASTTSNTTSAAATTSHGLGISSWSFQIFAGKFSPRYEKANMEPGNVRFVRVSAPGAVLTTLYRCLPRISTLPSSALPALAKPLL